MKVYLLNDEDLTQEQIALLYSNKMSDEDYAYLSKETGNIFSLKGFENYYNHDPHFDYINTHIRFME